MVKDILFELPQHLGQCVLPASVAQRLDVLESRSFQILSTMWQVMGLKPPDPLSQDRAHVQLNQTMPDTKLRAEATGFVPSPTGLLSPLVASSETSGKGDARSVGFNQGFRSKRDRWLQELASVKAAVRAVDAATPTGACPVTVASAAGQAASSASQAAGMSAAEAATAAAAVAGHAATAAALEAAIAAAGAAGHKAASSTSTRGVRQQRLAAVTPATIRRPAVAGQVFFSQVAGMSATEATTAAAAWQVFEESLR